MSRGARRRFLVHPFAAAFLLGALSALALPPIHAIPVLFLAVPGLLALIGAQPGMRRAATVGFWFGFGHHLLGLYWITEAILVRAEEFWWLVPLAVPMLAAVLAVFIAVPCGVARASATGWRRVLALAGAWVLADLARQFMLTGFPWNPLGSVWELPGLAGDVAIQPACLVGMPGLTFLTLLLTASPLIGRRAIAVALAAAASWAGFGAWHLSLPASKPQGVEVVLVQGNVAEGQKMDRALARHIFDGYLDLTRGAVANLHDELGVVVWPETTSLFPLDIYPEARRAITEASGGLPGLIGTLRFGPDNRPRNSLMGITSGGVAAIYDKFHLVPFGEYQPLWLPLPVQIVPGGGFVAGSGPHTMHIPGLPPVGPLICYEAIFPGAVVDPDQRPEWLVNVTNDAWFGNSTGPRQHLAAARARAVEEGLPLIRAANTGISAGFDAFGHELGRIGMNQVGTLRIGLPGRLPKTFFGRHGLLIPAVLAAISALIGMLSRPRPSQRYNAGLTRGL